MPDKTVESKPTPETPKAEPKAEPKETFGVKIEGLGKSAFSGSGGKIDILEGAAFDEEQKKAEAAKEVKNDKGEVVKPEDNTDKGGEKNEKGEEKPKKEESEEKPLILGRFKDLPAVEKSRTNLQKEYAKVVEDISKLEAELGSKLLDTVFESDLDADDEKGVVKDYRTLEKAYTIATQKRAEGRRKLAEHFPDDELLKAKKDQDFDKEWEELQKKPRNTIIEIARQAALDMYGKMQKKNMISQDEIHNENTRIKDTIETFKAEFSDYDAVKDEMNEYIKTNIPPGANLPTRTILKIAYDVVKGTKGPDEIKKVIAKAKADNEEENEKAKIDAGVESGSGVGGSGVRRVEKSKRSEEDDISDSIVAARKSSVFM